MVMKDGVFEAYGIRIVIVKVEKRRSKWRAGFGTKPSGFSGMILATS